MQGGLRQSLYSSYSSHIWILLPMGCTFSRWEHQVPGRNAGMQKMLLNTISTVAGGHSHMSACNERRHHLPGPGEATFRADSKRNEGRSRRDLCILGQGKEEIGFTCVLPYPTSSSSPSFQFCASKIIGTGLGRPKVKAEAFPKVRNESSLNLRNPLQLPSFTIRWSTDFLGACSLAEGDLERFGTKLNWVQWELHLYNYNGKNRRVL